MFFEKLLRFFDLKMEVPKSYGWFHLMFVAFVIIATFLLCKFTSKKVKTVNKVILFSTLIVIALEIYKQVNFSFAYEEGIKFDYQWYSFPWQFCSMPMYVGLLAGILRRGKVYDCLCAFLATYSVFAGVCVMVYPEQVFISTVGINIQSMICHGAMIVIGVYLFYSGHVKIRHTTILKALPVFAIALLMAVVMNEIAYQSGLLETETFNMFFVSPYCEPSLPVYSLVQGAVPYPFCLFIYIIGFSLAAYIILLIAIGIKAASVKLSNKTKTVNP